MDCVLQTRQKDKCEVDCALQNDTAISFHTSVGLFLWFDALIHVFIIIMCRYINSLLLFIRMYLLSIILGVPNLLHHDRNMNLS